MSGIVDGLLNALTIRYHLQYVTYNMISQNGTTSPTGGGRSVGIVRSRTKATEFSLVLVLSQNDITYNISQYITEIYHNISLAI